MSQKSVMPWAVFFILLLIIAAMVVLTLYYSTKVGDALKDNNLNNAKDAYDVSSSFMYFFSVVVLLTGVFVSLQAKKSFEKVYNRDKVQNVTQQDKNNKLNPKSSRYGKFSLNSNTSSNTSNSNSNDSKNQLYF